MLAMLVVGRITGKIDFRLLLAAGFGITAFSLWQMSHYTLVLSQSDIVSLHVPDTPATRGMIGTEEVEFFGDPSISLSE